MELTPLRPAAAAEPAATGLGKAGAQQGDDPARIKEAGSQFEALLISHLLKSMREASSSGWMGSGEDQASASMLEMAEERLAELMSKQGGLGLASLMIENPPTRAVNPAGAGGEKPSGPVR